MVYASLGVPLWCSECWCGSRLFAQIPLATAQTVLFTFLLLPSSPTLRPLILHHHFFIIFSLFSLLWETGVLCLFDCGEKKNIQSLVCRFRSLAVFHCFVVVPSMPFLSLEICGKILCWFLAVACLHMLCVMHPHHKDTKIHYAFFLFFFYFFLRCFFFVPFLPNFCYPSL